MSKSNPNLQGGRMPGSAQRAPIEQEMELKFPNFELLVTAMSANISTTGMFIQTPEPAPVGTTLSFRFRIEDWSPIQGTARIIWNRDSDEASDRPAGMGVQFVDVDAQSRRMIRYLVDKHLETGGEPFDLGSKAEIPLDLDNEGSTSSHASGPESHRLLWIVGAALMAGVTGLGLWFQLAQQPAAEDGPAKTVVSGAQTAASNPVDDTSEAQPSKDPASIGDREAERSIEQLIQDWSEAWERGEADELLSFYAPEFQPSGRETRAQWEARLRREISNAAFVRVAISALEISAPTASEGQATFYQSYRSDRRDETVRTSLELVRSDGGWRITRQTDSR